MSFNAIRENKILAKISGFTVLPFEYSVEPNLHMHQLIPFERPTKYSM